MISQRCRRAAATAAACAAVLLPARAPANDEPTRSALVARWAAASHRSPHVLQSNAGAQPPADLKRLVAAELSIRGRYRLAAEPAAVARPSLWLEFWQWVRDRWNDLWRAAFGRVHVGPRGAVVAGDALMALVALVLLVVAFRLLSGLSIERRTAARALRIETPRDASELYAAACAWARDGDYARASADLFAAAVASLSARGVVSDDRSATVGDLRRTLRTEDGALVAPFDDVASAFVAGTYAERALARGEWERARSSYLRLAGEPSA